MKKIQKIINSIQIFIILLLLLMGNVSCRMTPVEMLLILQPDSIEGDLLLSITTAAPTILVLSFSDNFSLQNLQPNPNQTTTADWQVNGKAPAAVYHYSRSVDELPKTDSRTYPVETRYWVYLELQKPLKNGNYYHLSGPYGNKTIRFDDADIRSESIKVNQVGYHPDSLIRYANLGVFLGTGGSRFFADPITYQVENMSGNNVVYRGTAEYRGDDTLVSEQEVTSGEYVYRLDLSEVPEGGPYRIKVDGFGVSYPFEVSYAAVEIIAETYTRGLYHQRCGIALKTQFTEFTRDICHTEVGDTKVPWTKNGKIYVDSSTSMFTLTGGYHDAADFDRRPYHTIIPILMLSYYEAFPSHFSDFQYNIPESGNGIPDFLDEALWGLKVWKDLQILDTADPDYGGILAGTETQGHPEYGKVDAATDTYAYGTWDVLPEVTAYGAGMMAQAARLLKEYPSFSSEAEKLYSQALLAWDYLRTHVDEASEPYINAEKTEIMYAALQLSLGASYFTLPAGFTKAEFTNLFEELAQYILVDGGSWPQQYLPGNIFATSQTAHFISYLLSSEPKNELLAQNIESVIFSEAESGGYMGFDPNTAFYPHGVSKAYGWGSATAQGRYADVYAFAYRLESNPGKKEEYFSILSQFGDYALGLNPLGVSYVTGLGSAQPQSPLHLDSYFTKYVKGPKENVPGILLFGPTAGRSSADYQTVISDTIYPDWDEMPLERRWADGWSLVNSNEFTVCETMVWNICLYGVLNRNPK
jgi:endoglucanase